MRGRKRKGWRQRRVRERTLGLSRQLRPLGSGHGETVSDLVRSCLNAVLAAHGMCAEQENVEPGLRA